LELTLHASRDFAYAILFASIGWLTGNGTLAWLLMLLLLFEIVVTLWDFIEEDRTRVLPPGERAGHAIMGILYGVFLAHLWPSLRHWAGLSTGFTPARYGWLSWLLTAMGIGVLLSGIRDLVSARMTAKLS